MSPAMDWDEQERFGVPVTPSPEPLGLDPLDALRSIAQHSGDPGSRWVAQKSLDRSALPSAPDHRLREALRPIVADWFDTGYEAGRLDPDVLTDRILAVLSEATPSSEPVPRQFAAAYQRLSASQTPDPDIQ